MERLDKRLAATGLWSRREVGGLVKAGRVAVNGVTACKADGKCGESDVITVDGKSICCETFTYLMLNKPAGLLSATEDKRQKTVLDLLPGHLRKRELFPVGRLDKDTEGLLLLTNDGALAHQLLSPKYHVDKVYYARVDGTLTQVDVEAFLAGMKLGDGLECQPAGLELLEQGRACCVTLREGKFHQVKRMLAARNAPVLSLKRLSMGRVKLDSTLRAGEWRPLTEDEIDVLRGCGGEKI